MRLGSMLLLVFVVSNAGCQGARTHPQPSIVGFRSLWALDPARSYRTAFDDGRTYGATRKPRPVLINIWYPADAEGEPMTHADYLQIEPRDPALGPLAMRLIEYVRNVHVQELLGGDGSPEAMTILERVLRRPTAAMRNARHAPGRFPLVFYHAGAGSSLDDNTLLCESLARDGFVVIGGAFQAADGTSFNIDVENAGREFEFLLRFAADLEYVDVSRVAIVGHSAGAHAALIHGARPGIGVDAIVALDTTQDYRTLADPRWATLTTALARGRTAFCTPTMFVAGPSAIFALGDTLTNAERVYLTVPDVDHNDYISQGELTAEIAALRNGDPVLAQRAETLAQTGQLLRAAVCAYLRARLLNDEQAWSKIVALEGNPIGAGLHVELLPQGTAAGRDSGDRPTPRSVHRALRRGGCEAAIAELSRAETLDPVLFTETFALSILYDLAASNLPDEAVRLDRFFLSRNLDVRPTLVAQAELMAAFKRHDEFVQGCVRLGRAIGASDPAVQEMIAKYNRSRSNTTTPDRAGRPD